MASSATRIVRFGIWLPAAIWCVVMATFLVVVSLLPKPSNDAVGLAQAFDVLGIFVLLFFALGSLAFVIIAVASMRALYIARQEAISRSERNSAMLGVSLSLSFFCLVGYLFLVWS